MTLIDVALDFESSNFDLFPSRFLNLATSRVAQTAEVSVRRAGGFVQTPMSPGMNS